MKTEGISRFGKLVTDLLNSFELEIVNELHNEELPRVNSLKLLHLQL